MSPTNAHRQAELRAWLRLVLAAEIGPVLAHRLLATCGTPAEIFDAPASVLRGVPGLGPARLEGLLSGAAQQAAREELDLVQAAGLTLITFGDPNYPALLRRTEHPPLVLWVRGALDPRDRLGLAVVGPRQPSGYARLMTESLVPPLAGQGLTIISGLAFGIDAAAHRAALEAGGRTLAVVGQGLGSEIYPQANRELAERIAGGGQGALVSIFPCRTEPTTGLFPLRNEVIAGLALGTLVVEASPTSGTLITARQAAAAGRTVLACPGDATRRQAQGANRLIAEGAALVQRAEDVLAGLGEELRREMAELGSLPTSSAPQGTGNRAGTAGQPEPHGSEQVAGTAPPPQPPDPLADLLVASVAEEPQPLDVLLERAAAAGYPLPATLERLLRLEMTGQLRQLPGRLYAHRM